MIDLKVRDEEEMAISGYDPLLAAQVAAVFLVKGGGSMDKMKLVKLLYLAEREAVRSQGRPMFFDENFSLEHGPAGTNALSGIDGERDATIWSRYLSLDGTRDVHVCENLEDGDFDEVSDANLAIIYDLWDRFGHMSTSAIRGWTHERVNLPEYVEVKTGREEIGDEVLARALGMPDPKRYARRVKRLREQVWGKLT